MAEYVNIRIRKDTYERLKELSAGAPLVRFLDDACRHWSNKDEADTLLDELDNKYEHPEVCLSAEDQELFDSLEPGELPECCQEYYTNGTKCRHWHKEYVKYFGKPVLGYRNTLTGGSNYDYVNEYQQ